VQVLLSNTQTWYYLPRAQLNTRQLPKMKGLVLLYTYSMSLDLQAIQSSLEYEFVNTNLLQTALTHRSFRIKSPNGLIQASNYERLEFLGDAVLELVITEYLYKNFDKSEGELTAIRSHLVNRHILAQIGQELGLDHAVRISDQERAEVGKARESIVADAVEAVLGAVYLEAGYTLVQKMIEKIFLPHLDILLASDAGVKDPKTDLQEWVQKHLKVTPSYKTLDSRGKDHQKEFQCGLFLGTRLLSTGWGKSKQDAQTMAARDGLEILKQETKTPHSA
jgi:ribonuclease III